MVDVTDARAARQGEALRELFIVNQLVSTRLNRTLRPLGISLSHVSFLSHLAAIGGQSSFSDLAAALDVNQPAVSKHMQALAALGAVEVSTAAGDARRRNIGLTPAGRALLSAAHEAMHPEATRVFGALDDSGLASITAQLAGLRVQLDEGRVE